MSTFFRVQRGRWIARVCQLLDKLVVVAVAALSPLQCSSCSLAASLSWMFQSVIAVLLLEMP